MLIDFPDVYILFHQDHTLENACPLQYSPMDAVRRREFPTDELPDGYEAL